MAADNRPGPRPVWNWLGLAFVIGFLVILFAPPAPDLPTDETIPPTSMTSCDPADTLCRALEVWEELQQNPPDTPAEREVAELLGEAIERELPEADTTLPPPAPVTSTTTTSTPPTSTTTTTSTVPAGPVPSVDDILDQLLGQAVPTTTTEVVTDGET